MNEFVKIVMEMIEEPDGLDKVNDLAEKDLIIHFSDLKSDCAFQPILNKKWSDISNILDNKVRNLEILAEEADYHRKKTKAKLWISIKKDPETYGFAKVTDKLLDAAVEAHDDYAEAVGEMLDAKQKVVDARRNSNFLKNTVTSFAQRKDMLVEENKLLIGNFYSSVNSNADKEVNDKLQGTLNKGDE